MPYFLLFRGALYLGASSQRTPVPQPSLTEGVLGSKFVPPIVNFGKERSADVRFVLTLHDTFDTAVAGHNGISHEQYVRISSGTQVQSMLAEGLNVILCRGRHYS